MRNTKRMLLGLVSSAAFAVAVPCLAAGRGQIRAGSPATPTCEPADNPVPQALVTQIARTKAAQTWGTGALSEPVPLCGADGKLVAHLFSYEFGASRFSSYEDIRRRLDAGRRLAALLEKGDVGSARELHGLLKQELDALARGTAAAVVVSPARGRVVDLDPIKPDGTTSRRAEVAKEREVRRFAGRKAIGADEFGTIVVSATRDAVPVPVYQHYLSPFFVNLDRAIAKAEQALGAGASLSRIYFLGMDGQYFEFDKEGRTVILDSKSLAAQQALPGVARSDSAPAASTPEQREATGRMLARAWDDAQADLTSSAGPLAEHVVPNLGFLEEYFWTHGCTPTASGMVLSYWDNYVAGLGKYAGWGNLIDYYYLDPAASILAGQCHAENVPNTVRELTVALGTDWDSATCSGSGVTANTWIEGGIRTVTNDRNGYGFTYWTCWDVLGGLDWCWGEVKTQVDGGRPLVWSTGTLAGGAEGHSVAAWGYRDDKYVILYDTWHGDSTPPAGAREDWYYTWYLGDSSRGINSAQVNGVFPGGGAGGNDVTLDTPIGGETIGGGSTYRVSWYQWGSAIVSADLFYSTDSGNTWTTLAGWLPSAAGWNYYDWRVPNIDSESVRVRIEAYDAAVQLSGDGSPGNATVVRDWFGPTGSFTINGGAAATNSQTVTLSMAFTDPAGVAEMCVGNEEACTAWEPYATSKSWLLTPGDSLKFVYVRPKDAVGNKGAIVYRSILLDTVAPVRTGGAPSGTLPPGTDPITVSLITSENATCRYSNTPGVPYAFMKQQFTTTGGTAHSSIFLGLPPGTHEFYVRCHDPAGNNNADDYLISFILLAAPYTINVNSADPDAPDANTGDGVCATASGVCTLRAAIQEANAVPSPATSIVLPAGLYTLTIPEGPSDDAGTGDLDVMKGAVNIIGAGTGATVIDPKGTTRIFHVSGGVTLNISNATLRNGAAPGDAGGCIANYGTLGLDTSVVEHCSATFGGAVYSQGPAHAVNTTIRTSSAAYGGGIYNKFAEFVVEKTTISGNAASGMGGGIDNYYAGTVTVTNSTISGNSAQSGGGIANEHGSATMASKSVTIANNSATSSGGGLYNVGTSTLKNTILAGNSGANCIKAAGTITSGGHNLEDANTCGLGAAGDLVGVSAMLGPLQNNGGPTSTHALLGGPAVDGGDNVGAPPTDQRDVARPQGPTVDIGAFERQPASADLALAMGDSPDPVLVGATLTYTLTMSNLGPDPAAVMVLHILPAGPAFVSATSTQGSCGRSGDTVSCALGTMAAGATATITVAVQPSIAGTVDSTASVSAATPDPNGANNSGAVSTTVLAKGTDLVEKAMSNPPASATRGANFTETDTVQNLGAVLAGPSVTRYYLSADRRRDVGDLLLTGSRTVPELVSSATSAGSASLTVPTTAPAGTFYLLACSDDTELVVESDELNNCMSSAGTIQIVGPDLAVTALSNPPGSLVVGGAFWVSDTTTNIGTQAAGESATRYYLSLDRTKGSKDKLLAATRPIPALNSGISSVGEVKLVVPSGTPDGLYYVLGCADGKSAVTELNEKNNCRASLATMQVTGPDLEVTSVTGFPASAAAGKAFTVSDTTRNRGTASAGASITRYYLSLDQAKTTGDKLLTGSRSVPILAAGLASMGGPTTVTVPATMLPGTYHVLACADQTKLVAESVETNNCSASGARITITP